MKHAYVLSTEVEIGRAVVDWLKSQHWEVYQEVQISQSGAVADLVATQGRLLWVIECKRHMGLAVIAQADQWRRNAHFVSVAVGSTGRRSFGAYVCRTYGIGVLTVGNIEQTVNQVQCPKLNRHAYTHDLRGALREPQKTFAEAGNADSLRWSPYRQTCSAVYAAVRAQPGIRLKELVAAVEHHYSSNTVARSCLAHWIECGKVPGVRAQHEGSALRIYPVETKV